MDDLDTSAIDRLLRWLASGQEQEANSAVAAQQFVEPYLKNVLTGQYAAGALPSYYDPNRSFAAHTPCSGGL